MHGPGDAHDAVPRSAQGDLKLERSVEVLGEERDRGPRARDQSGEGAVRLAELEDARERGVEMQSRGLQVVVESVGQH